MLDNRHADRRWFDAEAGPQLVTVQPLGPLAGVFAWTPTTSHFTAEKLLAYTGRGRFTSAPRLRHDCSQFS